MNTQRPSSAKAHPRQLPCLDPDPPPHVPSVDLGTNRVIAGWNATDGEVVVIQRVRMRLVAVGLDIRQRRFTRLGLSQAVDAGAGYWLTGRVPDLARDDARILRRRDPEFRIGGIGRETLKRIHDQ